MNRNRARAVLLLCVVWASTMMAAQNSKSSPAPVAAQFSALVDQYFDAYFQTRPTEGTSAGFHQYDDLLQDYSRAGVERRIALAREWLAKFERWRRTGWTRIPPRIASCC